LRAKRTNQLAEFFFEGTHEYLGGKKIDIFYSKFFPKCFKFFKEMEILPKTQISKSIKT